MKTIAVMYTYNLKGGLDILPKLYTFLRELKTPYSSGELGETTVIVLDLGNTCSADAWHCDVTDNRSMVIALDGMGFTAVNVQDQLGAGSRAKLEDQVTLALVDDSNPFMYISKIAIETQQGGFFLPSTQPDLSINLTPQDKTILEQNRLSLTKIEGKQIGVAVVNGSPYKLTHTSTHDLPQDTNPDPTIAGVVDFIISEARYLQKRNADS